MTTIRRRTFLRTVAATSVPLTFGQRWTAAAIEDADQEFKLSLNQRSLRRSHAAGEWEHLRFAEIARREFDIDAVDYSSSFFKDRADDEDYLSQMNRQAADQGVRQVLLMVDGEGALAAADPDQRKIALNRHRLWIDAAASLGCRGVCVRPLGDGKAEEQTKRFADSLASLNEHATERKIHVLISNDTGLARNVDWLTRLVKDIGSARCGAFPLLGEAVQSDPYSDIPKWVSIAKGLGVLTHAFDSVGNHNGPDVPRILKSVLNAGYRGFISLEYAGEDLDEFSGIRASQSLLARFESPLP